jgi:hypothetical protein
MSKKRATLAVAIAAAALATPAAASANVVTDWDRTMVAALEVDKTPPPPATRAAAIVQSSVFDAVNGIARRYSQVHVPPTGPRDASEAAAAAGAGHEALVVLFPAQVGMLDQQLATSVAQISPGDDARSIAAGLGWGKAVADQILTWRATDGSSTLPGYTPSGLIGRWAPTPPGLQTVPQFIQFAQMTPFAIASPAQFLPGPPPALRSARYAPRFRRGRDSWQRRQHRSHPRAGADRDVLAIGHAGGDVEPGRRRPD